MIKALHILNGDSANAVFKKSSIPGDVIVWREMLCEGKVVKDVGSDPFWKERYAYFQKEYGIEKLDYFDKTLKEVVKLQDVANFNEIVLWFEYDLFCQVNLMAAVTYLLKSYRKDIRYFLVCTGKEKGKTELQTLSDFTPSEYEMLYQNKTRLSRNDFLFAQKAWEIYAENDVNTLKEFDFNQNKKFVYLQSAMDQHLMRFKKENGLNQIDNQILEMINSGIHDKNNLIKELLIWQKENTVYGFGDLQYEHYIKKLNDYIEVKSEKLMLNKKGKSLI